MLCIACRVIHEPPGELSSLSAMQALPAGQWIMLSRKASSIYSNVNAFDAEPTKPEIKQDQMCSTTSRCSIIQNVNTRTTECYHPQTLNSRKNRNRKVSRKLGAIQSACLKYLIASSWLPLSLASNPSRAGLFWVLFAHVPNSPPLVLSEAFRNSLASFDLPSSMRARACRQFSSAEKNPSSSSAIPARGV